MPPLNVRAVLVGLGLLLAANVPALADATLLRCKAKDAVNLQNDGTLATDKVAQMAEVDSWTIDIANGNVWIGGGAGIGPIKWIVAQAGGGGNDTVLVGPYNSDVTDFSRADFAEADKNFIRVRQWTPYGEAKGPILFIRNDLGTVVSGTCEPIQP
jgi:hypothetical protein